MAARHVFDRVLVELVHAGAIGWISSKRVVGWLVGCQVRGGVVGCKVPSGGDTWLMSDLVDCKQVGRLVG